MGLKDLVDRKTTIEVDEDVSFEVRGLSLEDVILLLENHRMALEAIFSTPEGADFVKLVHEFPEFVAAAVAYAANESDMVAQVRKLPVGVQLRAIQEVWELSSLDVETVGKLAAGVLRGVTRLNAADLSQLRGDLTSGSTPLPRAQNS